MKKRDRNSNGRMGEIREECEQRRESEIGREKAMERLRKREHEGEIERVTERLLGKGNVGQNVA